MRRRLLLYAFKLILTNIQSEVIDKSAIISTQGWTNSLGTAHSKMGGPTFVNEQVVHILEKQSNIVLNFDTKEQRRLLLYALKWILTNIQSELINKSAIISTQGWTNSLGTTHSKMGDPTFVNGRVDRKLKKVVQISIKNFNIVVNFETKVQQRLLLYEFNIILTFIQISNLSSLTKVPLYPLMHVLDLSDSPLANDSQVKLGFVYIAEIIENQSGV